MLLSHGEALILSAHEVGHALIAEQLCKRHGVHVVKLTMDRRSGRGHTDIRVSGWKLTPDAERDQAICYAAGIAAEHLWYANNSGATRRPNRSSCQNDMADVARYGGHVGLSEGQAIAAATQVLRRHWFTVERLAPQLAERGILHW